MPRDDVILNPRTSAWSVHPDLDAALTGSPTAERPTARCSSPSSATPTAPVTPVPAPPSPPSALDADEVLATHEPGTDRGHGHDGPPAARGARGAPRRPRRCRRRLRRRLARGRRGGRPRDPRPRRASCTRSVTAATADVLAAYVEAVVLASWALAALRTRTDAVAGVTRRRPTAVVAGTADAATVDRAVIRARAQLVARGLAAHPLQHQEPRLDGATGPDRRPAHRPRRAGCGTSASCAARASAASSPSARARPRRRGWSASTTSPPARPPRPRGSCSSARASRSTPVACRSSRSTGMLGMKTDMSGVGHRPRGAGRLPRARACRCGSPGCSPSPRTPSAAGPTGPATSSRTTAAAPSRSATPTPRAASSWPTPSPTPTPTSTRPGSSTSRRSPGRRGSPSAAALAPVFATDAALHRRPRRRRCDDW